MKTVNVPLEPTKVMLEAARDWSIETLGHAVGNAGATGCYQAMLAAAQQEADHGYKRIGVGRCNQRGEVVDIAQSGQDAEMWAYDTVTLYVKESRNQIAATQQEEQRESNSNLSPVHGQSKQRLTAIEAGAPTHQRTEAAKDVALIKLSSNEKGESDRAPSQSSVHPMQKEAMDISYSPHRLHSTATQQVLGAIEKYGEVLYGQKPADAERLADEISEYLGENSNPDRRVISLLVAAEVALRAKEK